MTNRNSNNINIPEAREAMDKFKMEAASEVGVNLKNGYNGDLTSAKPAVGGQIVKNVCPIRIVRFIGKDRTAVGHAVEVRYIAGISV
ncbi:MAG: small, acid-soluble spore protein, alpha/beta type [Oscillospiraceae bacterium]